MQFKVMFFTFIAWLSPEWSQSSREKLLLVPNPPGDIKGAGGNNSPLVRSSWILQAGPRGPWRKRLKMQLFWRGLEPFYGSSFLFLYLFPCYDLFSSPRMLNAFYNVNKLQAKTRVNKQVSSLLPQKTWCSIFLQPSNWETRRRPCGVLPC